MTAYLYSFIIVSTALLSFLTQARSIDGSFSFNKKKFFACFLIHAVFMCFTKTGTDYVSYVAIINHLDWSRLGIEFGFNFLGLLFFTLTKDADLTIFFIKLITLIIYYYSFYLMRNRIRIVYSILAFNAFVYFKWYIIGMNLSISLLLLSGVILMERKTKKLPLLLVVIAASVHSSSWLFLPVYLLCYCLSFNRRKISIIGIILISSFYLFLLVFYKQVYEYLINSFSFFKQYRGYSLIDSSEGTGLFQFVNFAFIAMFIHRIYKKSNDKKLVLYSIVFTINAFFFALLAYKMSVFSRINNSSLLLYCYIVPYALNIGQIENNKAMQPHVSAYRPEYRSRYILKCSLFNCAWVGYLALITITLMIGLLAEKSTSSMNNYEFFWPF